MQLRSLKIPDAFEITPARHSDQRGEFFENYRFDRLSQKLGRSLCLAQANVSVSKKGVVRGAHYALLPSQAKYVSCLSGAVLDFVIDVRVGSMTFGHWDAVLLDDRQRKSVYMAEGLAHAFVALSDSSTVHYLCSNLFNPELEKGLNPLDAKLGLDFPFTCPELILSPKDRTAPTLSEALTEGLLPGWDECQDFYKKLNEAFTCGA